MIAAVVVSADGLLCIALGSNRALAPWTMGFGYGVGQMLIAGILLVTALEDSDEG